jgi:hypothetical protein
MKRWRVLFVLSCLALLLGVHATAGARPARNVVPVEGEWLGITNGGLPVSFSVEGDRVTDVHFSFHWGSCGRRDAVGEGPASPEIDSVTSDWTIVNPGGEYISGRFFTPERLEGRVVGHDFGSVGKSCPRSEEYFAAELGRVPTHVRPQVCAIDSRPSGHQSIRPHQIEVRPGLVFHVINWETFSRRHAHAHARVEIVGPGGEVTRRIAGVDLSNLSPHGGGLTYKILTYRAYGPLPHGFPRRGRFAMF